MKNPTLLLIVLVMLFMGLFLQQCSQTNKEKAKRETVERVATQNLKAMGDSTVQLKMTRKELAEADSALLLTVRTADSLTRVMGSKKDKVVEVIKTFPIIIQKEVEVSNSDKMDLKDSTRHLLDFAINDSIKSFNGSSTFYINRTDSTLTILPGKTNIKDFKLNFSFSVIKYEDFKDKVTKYRIVPFYVDSTGKETILTQNQIKFNFRGVELLDKAWQENESTGPGNKKKSRLVGKWGIGINPVGIGPVSNSNKIKIGITPSVSFGFFLTFDKR